MIVIGLIGVLRKKLKLGELYLSCPFCFVLHFSRDFLIFMFQARLSFFQQMAIVYKAKPPYTRPTLENLDSYCYQY